MKTLKIGVTGHRVIDDPEAVAREIRGVVALTCSAGRQEPAPAGAAPIEVISALAEGADRLVAHVLLEEPTGTLTVVLPFAKDDYLADFASRESKDEFLALLERAARVEVVGPAATRVEGYERAGRRIVDESDLVIAVWDGKPSRGRGGTAEIVEYARAAGRPVFWIRASEGDVVLTRL